MLTIGRLAELAGLSRSTLLYYDSLGLLSPSGGRSASGYRLYSEADKERLEQILLYRSLGFSLDGMRSHLDRPREGAAGLLLRRVFAINEQIQKLRSQQRAVMNLLEEDGTLAGARDRLHQLPEVRRQAGITRDNYKELHRSFERTSPRSHRRVLRHLGFSEHEINVFLFELRAPLKNQRSLERL